MDLKAEILKRVIPNAFITELLGEPKEKTSTTLVYLCPFHNDQNNPNLHVNTQDCKYYCFACQASGSNAIDLYMAVKGVEFKHALNDLAVKLNVPDRQIRPTTQEQRSIKYFHELKLGDFQKFERDIGEELLETFMAEYPHIPKETLRKHHIGYDASQKCYTFPIMRPNQSKSDIKRYFLDESDRKRRKRNWPQGYYPNGRKRTINGLHIFNGECIKTAEKIVICEGETTPMALEAALGMDCVGVQGAQNFKSDWGQEFIGKTVYLCMDVGEAGDIGAEKIETALKPYAKDVYRVHLPRNLGNNGDARDMIGEGRVDELELLFKNAYLKVDYELFPDCETWNLERCKNVIEGCFPGYWPEVEALFSIILTLCLEDNGQPVSLNLVGQPSSLKSTLLGFFEEIDGLTYRSDDFSPNSFVSHSANVTKKKLDTEVDLLPKIQHKCLITQELNTMFSRKEDDLREMMGKVTKVLDGEGLTTDKGTHGRRGYRGDYYFAWLGACTPSMLTPKVYRLMGNMGSRILFLNMHDNEQQQSIANEAADLTEKLFSKDEEHVRVKKQMCKEAAQNFLVKLWRDYGGVRGFSWKKESERAEFLELRIGYYARLVSQLRSHIEVYWDERSQKFHYNQPSKEKPIRAMTQLAAVAQGRALLYGRNVVTEDDIDLVRRVALDSCPQLRSAIFRELLRNGQDHLSCNDLIERLQTSEQRVINAIEEMELLGLVRFDNIGDLDTKKAVLDGEWSEILKG